MPSLVNLQNNVAQHKQMDSSISVHLLRKLIGIQQLILDIQITFFHSSTPPKITKLFFKLNIKQNQIKKILLGIYNP